MCRHCQRIVEHPEDREIVHAFMERTALRLSQMHGGRPCTADDLEVDVHVSFRPAPSTLRADVLRMLDEMDR